MKSLRHSIGFAVAISAIVGSPALSQQDKPQPEQALQRHRLEAQLRTLEERRAMVLDRLGALDRGEPVEALPPVDRTRRQGQPLSAEQRQRLLAVLGKVDLGDSDFDLRAFLSKESPESGRMMRRLAPRLRKLADLQEHDPELYELQRQELVAGIGIAHAMRHLSRLSRSDRASEEELQVARQNLKDAIGRGFEAKARLARLELKRAHDRYTSLSEELEQAESHREQRINERFDEMLRHIEQSRDGSPHREKPLRDRPGSGDD